MSSPSTGIKHDSPGAQAPRTPLKESNRLPLAEGMRTPLKDGTKTPLKESVFSFLDSPRSPFKTLLNFASLGNRGALSPNNRVSTLFQDHIFSRNYFPRLGS